MTSLPSRTESFVHLETVDLSRCASLAELPIGIGAWGGSLTSLRLAGCSSLEGLPESVERWAKLRTISLAGAAKLKSLPEEVRGWVSVERVNLNRCTSLERLPEAVANWQKLTSISLTGCPGVTNLSNGVTGWADAAKITIGCSGISVLPPLTQKGTPDDTQLWQQLEILDLSGCDSLLALPSGLGGLPHLRELNLSGCSSLNSLSNDFGQLALTTLRLDDCKKLSLKPNEFYRLFRGSEETLYWLFVDGCRAFEDALKLALLADVAAVFRRQLESVRARKADSREELGEHLTLGINFQRSFLRSMCVCCCPKFRSSRLNLVWSIDCQRNAYQSGVVHEGKPLQPHRVHAVS